MMALVVILSIILIYILVVHREPPLLVSLKEKYNALLAYLHSPSNKDPRWERMKRRAIVTGLVDYDKSKGPIAYNVNKGYEICICLAEDDINSAFYVLLHELAHMSVTEYDHSTKFWKNFSDLKMLCDSLGIYNNSAGSGKYCGDSVIRS